jgi:hypothetical protein
VQRARIEAHVEAGTWKPKPAPAHPLIPGVRIVMAEDIARGIKRADANKLHNIRLGPSKSVTKRAARARAEALLKVLYEE